MNSFENFFLESSNKTIDTKNEQESTFIQYCKVLSSVITDSFYVFDIAQKQFCYIKSDNSFLCNYSIENAMKLNYYFYTRIIHPEDLSLWENILNIISQCLDDRKDKLNEIEYFSCYIRLLRKYSFSSRFLSQMIYQRMKPIYINNNIRYLICTVRISSNKNSGELLLQNKDNLTYEKYNFSTKKWEKYKIELLTEREQAILMLAQQCKNTVEIANELCKGKHTIRNLIKVLFSKLNVHSMQEALQILQNRPK